MMSSTALLHFAYVAVPVMAIIFSILINGLLLKFSRTLGSRQIQHRRNSRWSTNIKPSVGGFSFYFLFLISLSIYGIFEFKGEQELSRHLLGMIFAVNTGFILGLADDAYDTIPMLKFFGQLLCGIFLVGTDSIIRATGIYSFDVAITILWVVGIMNSINMLDNMDGISATVSLFILFSCLFILYIEGNFFSFYTLMLFAVSGALVGFLYFNWYPARIYMGDTGSQFLGAFLSAITIQILWKYHSPSEGVIQLRQYLIPLIAFTVPIIDTATVFIRRILRGQSPFVGGRDHISHHFVYAGLSDLQVIYLLGGWSMLSAFFATALSIWRYELTPPIVYGIYSYFIVLFIIVQYVYDIGMEKERRRTKEGAQNDEVLKSASKHSATA